MAEAEQPATENSAAAGSKTRLIIAAGLGNFLEIFDFSVYSYFATIIGLVMLKTQDLLVSTYISAILFGSGFLARPLGSLFLGSYADRHGRKPALLLTILLMGLGSACIAFAPPYAAIGIAAPLLIVAGRLLQGFSSGGEIGIASALLLESALPRRRGVYVAGNFMMQGASSAGGALCALGLFSLLPDAAMRSWGWRVPFLFALLIIPVGLYIRAHISETYRPQTAQAQQASPLRQILQRFRFRFCWGILSVMPVTLLVYSLVIYMPTYLSLIHIEAKTGAAALTQGANRFYLAIIISAALCAASYLGGLACDRFLQRRIFAVLCLTLALIGIFMTYYCVDKSLPLFLIGLFAGVIALGMMMPVQAIMVMESFPRPLRATAFAVSLSCGSVLFGGTAQIILTKMLMLFNAAPFAPFYYLAPMLVIGIIAYACACEEHYD